MTGLSAERTSWAGFEPVVESTRPVLREYLRALGISGEQLLNSLATECLNVARRRVGPGSREELLRRAIEEAQRRLDAALARSLGLSPTRDVHQIAGARAALLIYGKQPSSDFLFDRDAVDPDVITGLKAVSPMPVPPEVPRPMVPQKLEFLFFKSS